MVHMLLTYPCLRNEMPLGGMILDEPSPPPFGGMLYLHGYIFSWGIFLKHSPRYDLWGVFHVLVRKYIGLSFGVGRFAKQP